MRIWSFRYAALGICAAAILTGCGGSPPAIGARASSSARLTTQRARPNATYAVIYSFKGGSTDGAAPSAPLLEVNGALYGTTAKGGDSGNGTVFSIATSGVETVLHNFEGGSDGADPLAGLIDVDGVLYGTTFLGGPNSLGVVYRISTGGVERVLHLFTGGPGDGRNPWSGLLDVKGTLYGTAWIGGNATCGCGAVYSIGTRGKEKIIYTFSGSKGHDGEHPQAPVIDVNNMLYGTTANGGYKNNGVVYSVSTGGTEQVLHVFRKKPYIKDGAGPFAGLVNVNGTLYGTTLNGGSDDDGTVYSISTSGEEKVLYSFHGYDGLRPYGGLINVNGTLYGTTQRGGSPGCKNGCGTVYSITTQGEENVLYNFGSSANDGESPTAGLINVNGTLYGTTVGGGTYRSGTVFALTP